MGDEHLDTIPETESDEFIKSSVEDLVPIPSESEGIPDKMCDMPLCENTTPLNALNEHYEIVVNSDDDNSLRVKTILPTVRIYDMVDASTSRCPVGESASAGQNAADEGCGTPPKEESCGREMRPKKRN
ncbi:hypothetical protein Tco_1304838 [Tanacetum coccineum]